MNQSMAIICVSSIFLSAVAAFGQTIDDGPMALDKSRHEKPEGANARSRTWSGKTTMDRTGKRQPYFYIREPDGSRGPMIRKLKVKIVQDPEKRAKDHTDTTATVSFWFYNGASYRDGKPGEDPATALILRIGTGRSDIPSLRDDGTEVEGPVRVELPMWKCWYNRYTWSEDPHVTQSIKLRDLSFVEIEEVEVTLEMAPARKPCTAAAR